MEYPKEKHFINIHSHRKPMVNDEWVLRNAFCNLNTANLHKLNYAVSVGIHPWYIPQNWQTIVKNFHKKLVLSNVFAIGEIGLDRYIKTDFELQKLVFEQQLIIANKISKPVVVHAVKTYSDIYPYIKKYQIPFIFHQYRGNVIQTNQYLNNANVYFSFGKDLIDQKENVVKVFKELPLNKIFLETDVSSCLISEVYSAAAEIKNIDLLSLKKQIQANFLKVF